jgi:hypothetical protein
MGAVGAGRDAARIGDGDEELEVDQIETHGRDPSSMHRPEVIIGQVIPGRCEASNPESRDSPMRNCASEVWC